MAIVVDAEGLDLKVVSARIKSAIEEGDVVLENAAHLHGLAAGLAAGEITVRGVCGDYLGVLNDGARITVEGDAGKYLGDNMTRGEIIVTGGGDYGVGQYCYGGTIVVHGDAGDFSAVMNKGATVIVGGHVGDEVGTYMLGGDVIVLGSAGRNLGNYLIRGNLYVAGEIKSLGHNTKETEIGEADLRRLAGYFEQYGISADPHDFVKIVPLSEKPFYKNIQRSKPEAVQVHAPALLNPS
jgi:glutamate synthase domain-containing protein 3